MVAKKVKEKLLYFESGVPRDLFTSDRSSLSLFFSYLQFFMGKRDFFTTILVPKKSMYRKKPFIFVDPEFHLRRLRLCRHLFHGETWPFSLLPLLVLKGFVSNFCTFSVGTCMVFFKKNEYLQRLSLWIKWIYSAKIYSIFREVNSFNSLNLWSYSLYPCQNEYIHLI